MVGFDPKPKPGPYIWVPILSKFDLQGFAMHAAALKQQWSTAFVLYDALRQASGRPSGVTVNNLALALRRLLGRQWVSTTLLLEEMRLQQLRSNVVFLGNAVQSYSTCRRWSRALQLCMATGQVGIKCDAYVLSNVMSGMGRMVEWRRSLEVLEQADRKVAGQEDPALLNTAMSALAAAGEDVLALKLLKEMPNMQVRMDVISMATLIKAFERRSCWSKALEMLGQLPQRELGWSSIACSSAISSCRKGCHWTWTLHVLHLHSVQDTSCSAKRGVLPRTGPEESSYCCTVHACGEKSAWPDAIFLIDVMRAQRLRTSDVLFQHLPGIFMEPRRART